MRNLELEYYQVLQQQNFDKSKLDYSIFEKYTPFLNKMAQVKNSAITVFDLHKKEHIFNSYNLKNLFGYDLDNIDTDYYNSKIHPEDFVSLLKIGISVLKNSYKLPIAERKNYKLQNEYRILNSENKYIRVIEQFQTLELDEKGNFWLALSTMDISPNQEEYNGIRSQWVNTKTGEINVDHFINIKGSKLSNRENQILFFVNKGLLSKEISEKLSISVHTVNTHRQNILKKLGANSSIEAIKFAKELNLV